MKEELTDNGFQELLTSNEVNDQLSRNRDNPCHGKFSMWMFGRFGPSGCFDGSGQQPKETRFSDDQLRRVRYGGGGNDPRAFAALSAIFAVDRFV